MKNKVGRKSKYETVIKPNLSKIKKMAEHATDKDIAKQLGISVSSLMSYKNDHEELRKAIEEGRYSLVEELKSSLYEQAVGYQYLEETITYDNEGNVINRVVHKKNAKKDSNASNLLLTHYDPNCQPRKKQDEEMEIKREEVKLKIRALEQNEWK